MAEAIAVLQRAGRDRRRSRRHPERRRRRIRAEQPAATGAVCSGLTTRKGSDADCSVVFKYGMKRDFNAWLASLGRSAPVKSLDRAARVEHGARRTPARSSTASRSSTSPTRWTSRRTARAIEADRAKDIRAGGDARHRRGDEGAASSTRCCFPAASGAAIAAQARLSDRDRAVRHGAERADAAVPAGFDAKPAPFGVSFTGMACSEPRLIELAYAFEQATKRRIPPRSGLTRWNSDDRQNEVGITRGGRGLPAGRATSALERSLGPRRTTIGVVALPLEEPDLSRAVPADLRLAARGAHRSTVPPGVELACRRSVHRAAGSVARRKAGSHEHRIARKRRAAPPLAHHPEIRRRPNVGYPRVAGSARLDAGPASARRGTRRARSRSCRKPCPARSPT